MHAHLSAVFANAICLGLEDYSPTAVDPVTLQPDASRSAINAFISSVEPLFTALFTFEAVMKIIAMGLVVNRGSYLRDGFNILDAVVVISALLGAIPGVPNISALRAVRVLRPLRTLSRIKSMRIMVGSLLVRHVLRASCTHPCFRSLTPCSLHYRNLEMLRSSCFSYFCSGVSWRSSSFPETCTADAVLRQLLSPSLLHTLNRGTLTRLLRRGSPLESCKGCFQALKA